MPGLVTVIVTTRDRPAQLERALGSVQRQTWESLEVVVVDDASISNSDEIVAASVRRGLRVRLHRRDTPGGPAVSRNDGLIDGRGSTLHSSTTTTRWLPT